MHIRHDWLLAALVACCACKSHDEGPASLREKADQAEAAAHQAEAEAARAEAAAHQAQATVDQFNKELAALDAKLAEADSLVKSATTDDERKAAAAQLDELRKQRLKLEQRIMAAKAAAEKAERAKGVHISKECLENPLAKGCS